MASVIETAEVRAVLTFGDAAAELGVRAETVSDLVRYFDLPTRRVRYGGRVKGLGPAEMDRLRAALARDEPDAA